MLLIYITNVIKELKRMQSSEDLKTQDTSKGLLVQLGFLDIHEEPPEEEQPQDEHTEGEHPPENHQSPDEQQVAEDHPREPPPSYQETMDAPHIMISYNWDHQDRALKIRDKLKEKGYNIWMDVDKMGVYISFLYYPISNVIPLCDQHIRLRLGIRSEQLTYVDSTLALAICPKRIYLRLCP